MKKEPIYFELKHKQTVVADYKYPKNGARVRVYEVNPPWSGDDSLMFHLLPGKGNGEPIAFRLRPDEAIMISRLLLEAVYKTTTAYEYTPIDKQDPNQERCAHGPSDSCDSNCVYQEAGYTQTQERCPSLGHVPHSCGKECQAAHASHTCHIQNPCTCASFFTVRGVHKENCPQNHNTKPYDPCGCPVGNCNCATPTNMENVNWEEELRSIWQNTRENEGKYEKVKAFLAKERESAERRVFEEVIRLLDTYSVQAPKRSHTATFNPLQFMSVLHEKVKEAARTDTTDV